MLARRARVPNESRNRRDAPADPTFAEIDSEEAEIDRSAELKTHVRTLFAIFSGICTHIGRVN